ncbi:hypothetical protein AAHE18_08G101900 [Arachis hypogaea]
MQWCSYRSKGCFNLVICLSKRNSRTIASHQEKVQQPLDYITENGIDEYNDPTLSLEEALLDTFRVDFYYHHLF